MIKKVDHVSMAVKDMDAALATFKQVLGLTTEGGFDTGTAHDTRLAMLPTAAGARVELAAPGPESDNRFSQFIAEHGEGVYGLCIFIDNFDAEVERLKGLGITVEEVTQQGLFPDNPLRLAWTFAHGVWIELVDWNCLPDFEK